MSAAKRPLGPWRFGLRSDDIVADHDTGHDTPESVEFYGGHLVAESIPSQYRPLLAAAPELLEALRCLIDGDEGMWRHDAPSEAWDEIARAAIAKATGSAS